MISRYTIIALILLSLTSFACRDRNAREEQEKQYKIIQSKLIEPPLVDPLPDFASPDKIPNNPASQLVRLPEVNPLEVEGSFNIAGSSTVFPLAQAIYQRFIEDGYGEQIKLSSIGSGAGFRFFCQSGETDIANASRPIKAAEIAQCQNIDRQPIEFRVGVEALAIVMNSENKFVNNVTKGELRRIFTAEKWSDVKPNWPEERILRFIPDLDSGTLDFFAEEIAIDKEELASSSNTNINIENSLLTEGVDTNPYAIGFLGYADYQKNVGNLHILSIEGVTASPSTVEDHSYPLSRPLFIYSDRKIMQEKPQVAAFINYFLTYMNEEIRELGYFPVSESVINVERTKFLQAIEP